MNWQAVKIFFKPDLSKMIVFYILSMVGTIFLIFYLFLSGSISPLFNIGPILSLAVLTFLTGVSIYLFPQLLLLSLSIAGLLPHATILQNISKSAQEMFTGSYNLNLVSTATLISFLIFSIPYWYVLSCLIVGVIRKVRKSKVEQPHEISASSYRR